MYQHILDHPQLAERCFIYLTCKILNGLPLDIRLQYNCYLQAATEKFIFYSSFTRHPHLPVLPPSDWRRFQFSSMLTVHILIACTVIIAISCLAYMEL